MINVRKRRTTYSISSKVKFVVYVRSLQVASGSCGFDVRYGRNKYNLNDNDARIKAIRELGPLYGNVDKGMYSKWSKLYDSVWTKDDFVLAAHRKGIHGGQAHYKFEKLILNQLSMRLIEEVVNEDGNITDRTDKIINLAYSQEMIKMVFFY